MAFLFVPIVLILMYLMLLRPQQQRLRNQRQLAASLDVGDDIVTAGGIIGRIMALSDERATIEVADGVTIDFLRAAISRKVDDVFAGGHSDLDAEDTDIDLSNESDDDVVSDGASTERDRERDDAGPDGLTSPHHTDEDSH